MTGRAVSVVSINMMVNNGVVLDLYNKKSELQLVYVHESHGRWCTFPSPFPCVGLNQITADHDAGYDEPLTRWCYASQQRRE